MKAFLFLLAFSINTVIFSQQIITKTYNSKELKTKRNLKIYIPKNYDKDVSLNYPVAIILGDDYLFDLYVGNAKLFADADKAPRQIIIGINMNKTYDRDVSIVPSNDDLTSTAKLFQRFIKNEVLPYAEATYRTSPFISIVGEGKAANLVFSFLKDQKPIFNAYICAAPYFSNLAPRSIESYSLNRLNSVDNSFFIYTSANKKYVKTEQYTKFNQISNYLNSFTNTSSGGLHINFDEFSNAPSLLSMMSETIPRAFTQMFSIYAKITKDEYETTIKDLEPLEAIKYLEKKYLDIEYLYGNNLNVRLDDIFTIEGIVTDKQDGDYLRVLGDFVLIKYPDLHLGDYYIGKYYELGKDYEKADFYYKAAFGKMDPSDPNANAFYENIKHVNDLWEKQKSETPEPLEEEAPIEEENQDENTTPTEEEE